MAIKSFGNHRGEEVVEDVYTSELVGNSGTYGVSLESKFTVHIFWFLSWKKREMCRPRRRWREQNYLKANELHKTGLAALSLQHS
jgi:hypothetical protein